MKNACLSALIAVLAFTAGLAEEPSFKTESRQPTESASLGNLLQGLFTGPYKIRKERNRAKKLVPSLPDFETTVTVPDSGTIYSWIEGICQTPHRRPGTPEDQQAEKWVAERFREFGLSNVTLDPIPLQVWTAEQWSLRVGALEIPSFYVLNTGWTGPEGVSAPLVYVGTGKPKDFEKVEVKGKIVVAEVPILYLPTGAMLKLTGSYFALSDPDRQVTLGYGQYLTFLLPNFTGYATEEEAPARDVYWQAYRRGALAICLILKGHPSNSNTHYGPYDGIMKPLPGLWIGNYDGERLRALAQQGAEASLLLQGRIEPGVTHNVWGVLPGASDEVILVTSHHDAPFLGAVEDGAGVAQVLAQAWAWSRLPQAKRPKTLVFVVDAGHFYGSIGAAAFAREHREIMQRTRVLVTLEHLGAKDVEERDREYAETGQPALTILFTSHDPEVIATVAKGLEQKPLPATVSLPVDLLGPTPPSDAARYISEAGVPAISWITGPAYLLDAYDTLDKVDQARLKPIAETVAGMIGTFMALP